MTKKEEIRKQMLISKGCRLEKEIFKMQNELKEVDSELDVLMNTEMRKLRTRNGL